MDHESERGEFALGAPDGPQIILDPGSHGHIALRLAGRFVQAGDALPLEPTLPAFLRDLAGLWRGWEGVREWVSMNAGCTIHARHDGLGHISLRVSLKEPGISDDPVAEPWNASLEIWTDAAQLSGVADRLDECVGEPYTSDERGASVE